MNRRTLLSSLLSGLTAGVAAIAGRKQPTLSANGRLVGASNISLAGNLRVKGDGLLIPVTDTESLFGSDPGKLITNAQNGFMVRNIDDDKIYIYRGGWIRCFPEGGLIDA